MTQRKLYLMSLLVFWTVFFLLGMKSVSPSAFHNPYNDLLKKFLSGSPLPKPAFELLDAGLPSILDYSKYGEFQGAGTTHYRYVIKDMGALKKDIGEGIYPNFNGVQADGRFRQLQKEGQLKTYYWDVVNADDKQKAFYIWTQALEEPGLKTFFIGKILEDAGLILPALKAYYAALVHFPRSACMAADHSFVWYIAPVAISEIKRICRDYPDLQCALQGAAFEVTNGRDIDLTNDIIKVNPGKLIHKIRKEANMLDLSKLKVKQKRGKGKIQLVEYANGHWQMLVDKKPFVVRGVSYAPTEVGLGPDDKNSLDKWMFSDKNHDGIIDAPYQTWVDKNNNGIQDDDEKAIGDFQLLKDMGVNTIRWFAPDQPRTAYAATLVNKPLFRDLFEKYGIRVAVGDFFGAYTIGSGADWTKGTDYTDPEQRKAMKEVVRQKVMDLKDEPFVLLWILGNENNLPPDYMGVNATRTNAGAHPQDYAKFLDEVSRMIHELDPDHPVAVGNVGLDLVEYYRKYAPNIDILGINEYRGEKGFGTLFEDAKALYDRPVLITEYGCDAYDEGKGVNEQAQKRYHFGNIKDIVLNQAGGPQTGNSIGGIIFEYIDEWWKDVHHPYDIQQTKSQFPFPFPDGHSHEEWYGITSQGTGKNSPFERHLRETYFLYQDLWNPSH